MCMYVQRLMRKEKRQKKENVPISFKFMIFFLFWNFDFNLNKKVFDWSISSSYLMWFMMIYEVAIKSWFLAPMFWGQFRCVCCTEKYQRKLVHYYSTFFFLLLVFFCYWGNGFLLPSSRRSRWSVINFLCSSCRQSGFWGQPTHIHGEGLLSILDPNTTKRKRSFLRIIFRNLW